MDECIICNCWIDPMMCSNCGGTVCERHEVRLKECKQCGESDLCPECLPRNSHTCDPEEE